MSLTKTVLVFKRNVCDKQTIHSELRVIHWELKSFHDLFVMSKKDWHLITSTNRDRMNWNDHASFMHFSLAVHPAIPYSLSPALGCAPSPPLLRSVSQPTKSVHTHIRTHGCVYTHNPTVLLHEHTNTNTHKHTQTWRNGTRLRRASIFSCFHPLRLILKLPTFHMP